MNKFGDLTKDAKFDKLTFDSGTYKFAYTKEGTGVFVDITSTTGKAPCFDKEFEPETESKLVNPF